MIIILTYLSAFAYYSLNTMYVKKFSRVQIFQAISMASRKKVAFRIQTATYRDHFFPLGNVRRPDRVTTAEFRVTGVPIRKTTRANGFLL